MIRFLQSGNKAAKYLLGGLMFILALSMVAYLIPGFMSGTNITDNRIVAKVGGQEISTQDVQKLVNVMRQQQGARGQNIPDMFFTQQAVQVLIVQAELRYESERLGLRVSDEEVRDDLRNGQYAELFYPGGNWIGQDKYEDAVRTYFNTTPDEFERQIRLQVLVGKLQAAVAGGVMVSPAEVEKAYRDKNLKIKFDYALINADDVKKGINPTEAELKAYYEANKKRYENSIQEKRQVRYFQIGEKQAESKVIVKPVDIDRYYHDNQDEFRTEDRVQVRHILIKTPQPGPDGKVDQKAVDAALAKAQDVLKQLKAGADFAELAKKYSDDTTKEQGGELGWQGHDSTFVPEFKHAMFALNKGQISDPVKSPFGFHIIQVENKEVAGVKPLSEVKGTIEQALKAQQAQDILQQMGTAAETDARTLGLDKTAAKYGATVVETGPIQRADTLAGIGPAPDLMSEIFTTKEKAAVQSVQTAHGYVFFEVTKVITPRTPDFSEIKDKVTNQFKGERVNALVTKKTADLADRAHALHDLHKAAKELGATLKTSELVTRSSQVPDIGYMSGPSASKLFDLKVGEISGPVAAGPNDAVAAILERQEPSLAGDDFAKAKDNLREELLQTKRQEALELFRSNLDERLRKEGTVKENQSATGNLGRRRS